VFCTLYILRRDGKKLPVDEVRAAGILGRLEFGPSKKVFYPRNDAWFSPADGTPELRIVHAHITFIAPEGMMVLGRDDSLSHDYDATRQAWWVVPMQRPPEKSLAP